MERINYKGLNVWNYNETFKRKTIKQTKRLTKKNLKKKKTFFSFSYIYCFIELNNKLGTQNNILKIETIDWYILNLTLLNKLKNSSLTIYGY